MFYDFNKVISFYKNNFNFNLYNNYILIKFLAYKLLFNVYNKLI